MDDTSPYLTEQEAAAYLRLSPNHLGVLRRTGKGPPAYKPSGTTLYHREELEAWVRGRLSAPPQESGELVTSSEAR